jgi:hypothetical protein
MKVMPAITIIAAIAAPAAGAQVWDKKTTITVNQPFEVPGRVLPAGIVRLVDVAGVRNVVRFYNADEKKVYTTLIGKAADCTDSLCGSACGLHFRRMARGRPAHLRLRGHAI